ncbi:oligosaccharide flippase family protein [Vibrio cyclitrophicus]
MLNSIKKMLSGNVLKIIIQSILFLVLARFLGVEDFGLFSVCISVAGILCAFDALGTGTVLLKKISRNKCEFESKVATVMLIHIVTALLLIFLYVFLMHFLFNGVTIVTVLKIAFSEIFLYSFILLLNQMYQSLGKFSLIVFNNISLSSIRLLSVFLIGWYLDFSFSIDQLSSVYLCATFLSFLASCFIFLTTMNFKLSFQYQSIVDMITEGVHFSLSKLSAIGNSEADKAMLGQMKVASEVGVYSISHRIIGMVMVPVNTVFSVTMPKYFEYGEEGFLSNYRFSLTFVPYLLAYALICAVFIYFLAEYVVIILGDSYGGVAQALRYLALFPFIKIISTSFGDAIAGVGYQAVKSKSQIVSLIINIILNIIFIPLYSWKGAVFSLFISEFLLFMMYVVIIRKAI